MLLHEWKESGRYFEDGGLSVFYHREGRGETLLCLHGFPTSSFDYHKIWKELTGRFDVVAFDMIGFGFSLKPADWGYTTFDQTDVLRQLLKYLGLAKVHILAHDHGNTITQELLARDAEGRLEFEIASVCFMNGALFPETHRPIFAQKVLISPIGSVFGRLIPDAVFKKNLARVFGPATRPSERELEDHLALFKNNGGKRIAHRLIRYMAERKKYRTRWVAPLEDLALPFRFIDGLADPVSGEHLVKRFREVLPRLSDIVELEGIGHFPHLECPAEVLSAYLDFRDITTRP